MAMQRTAEQDVLREMSFTLNKLITGSTRYGDAAAAKGFISSQKAQDLASTIGLPEYNKVTQITAAIRDHIITRSPEQVTEKFSAYVLMIDNDLEDRELAEKLVQALSAVKPGYKSPLLTSSSASNTQAVAHVPDENTSSTPDENTSSTSVSLSELLEYVGIPKEALKKRCTGDHLREIAKKMDNWEYYAGHLGLSPADIDDLKEEFKKSGVKKDRALLLWKQKAAFKANYLFLVEVFLKCDNAEMAEFVCNLCKK